MQDGVGVNLFDDVAGVNGGGRGAALLHLRAELTQIIGRDFGQQAVLPERENIAVENRLAHRARAFRHIAVLEPALAGVVEGRHG